MPVNSPFARLLPDGVTVLERGWLSSNMVVLRDDAAVAVVDSGYCTHAAQTLGLVASAAGGLPVTTLVNTHLHSDHCGGNAALQQDHPHIRTLIPPGLAAAVEEWDEEALTHRPTGQQCPRFRFDGTLGPGAAVRLGLLTWEVHAAPGHDPHSIILFEPESRVLISADALWERGFGVVFPELEGEHGFDEVEATLALIERLRPAVVVPGHGAVFSDFAAALSTARGRLASFRADPRRHASHAAKVLLKFKLLEWQQIALEVLLRWSQDTPYFGTLHERFFRASSFQDWVKSLIADLARSGAAVSDGTTVSNH
ncbi:MBL fold metallo-hydrolase [Ramlibacter sp.]|uniref:MBL fold metallo-hydrolase n=1 Tax=Ramlibacter sp. TaxID=1917967 RepID=UPI00260245C4|nr:MBL fold metallo-hydrolase [Ramlibacter sp.]MDB5958690.1 beta-lactamase domain protein [Ramlibacter sp.]